MGLLSRGPLEQPRPRCRGSAWWHMALQGACGSWCTALTRVQSRGTARRCIACERGRGLRKPMAD
eukprot:365139-Chlamydomonas_euryale.AAC.16